MSSLGMMPIYFDMCLNNKINYLGTVVNNSMYVVSYIKYDTANIKPIMTRVLTKPSRMLLNGFICKINPSIVLK